MFLKPKFFLILFVLIFIVSCKKEKQNTIIVKIKNNTEQTIMFDKPKIVLSALEFQNTEKKYLNKNINILRKVEQINSSTDMKTLFNSIPYVEIITLHPKEVYEAKVSYRNLDITQKQEYLFFFMSEHEIPNRYNYYNYIEDMKKLGFFVNKKTSGKKIN